MMTKDTHFLNKQQTAEAEDEDVLGDFVASPQHVGFQAGGLVLVFMQEQQRLYWGGRALAVLAWGHGLVTGPRCILQQGQEALTAPPEQTREAYSREVAEGKRGGVTD